MILPSLLRAHEVTNDSVTEASGRRAMNFTPAEDDQFHVTMITRLKKGYGEGRVSFSEG
jgi:hypothetical protein